VGAKEAVDADARGDDAPPYDDIVTAVNQLVDRTRTFMPEVQRLQDTIRGGAGSGTSIGEVGELVRLLTAVGSATDSLRNLERTAVSFLRGRRPR
jgi:hypothetical protein